MVSNSRTKLRMKLLNVEKRDNIEFYLCCKFQCSPFSVRCKTDVTDGMTNELPYAVAPPLGIIIQGRMVGDYAEPIFFFEVLKLSDQQLAGSKH